jgi:two-component system, cell cycle sensor histidine kinase and response regulator CckA
MRPSPTIVETLRSAGGIGNLRTGVVTEDAAGIVTAANRAFCQIWDLALEPADLVGQPAARAGRPPDDRFANPERVRERLETLAAGRIAVFEEGLRRADGVIVDVDYLPHRVGEAYGGCTWVYRIATDLRRADEIRTHARDLEQRVVERTQELARANLELQASLRHLSQTQEQLIHAGKMAAVGSLVAGLSHELNNPLGVIVGYAQGLLRRTALDGPSRDALVAIERQAQRSAHLIRSLLDFSRNTRSPPQETAVPALVERVLELAAGQAHRNGIELLWKPRGPLPTLVSCPQDIESALMNLVSNGIDATPSGGSVTITAGPASRSGRAGLEISVIDTGSGIAQSVLPRIFDPFFTTRRESGGTGLGLSTVHGIVRQSDGFLAVESEIGKGTRFRLYLPRHDATELVTTPPVPKAASLPVSPRPRVEPGRTVLLVDDEDMVRGLAERALRQRGWEVLSADSAEAALALLEGRRAESGIPPPSVLVSDVVMPGMDGPALVHAVRADYPDMPAILVSGYAEEALRQDCTGPGIVFLSKPYTLKALLATVQDATAAVAEPASTASC